MRFLLWLICFTEESRRAWRLDYPGNPLRSLRLCGEITCASQPVAYRKRPQLSQVRTSSLVVISDAMAVGSETKQP